MAGLIESDGWISVPKSLKDAKGRHIYPQIGINFDINQKPLAELIQRIIGFGSIHHCRNKANAIELLITGWDGYKPVVQLVNGKFRTPKISALHRLILFLNSRFPNEIILPLPLDTSPLSENAPSGGLAGFSDGDSSFQVRTTETTSYRRADASYELQQSRVDFALFSAYETIMRQIAALFLTTAHSKQRKGNPISFYWLCRSTSSSGRQAVVDYFDRFPLFSSKHLDYLAWREIHLLLVDRAHHKSGPPKGGGAPRLEAGRSGDVGFNRIKELKASMNHQRTVYTWDHLANFYSE